MGLKGHVLSLSQRIRLQLASFMIATPQLKLLIIEDVARGIHDIRSQLKVKKAITAVLKALPDSMAIVVTDHKPLLQ